MKWSGGATSNALQDVLEHYSSQLPLGSKYKTGPIKDGQRYRGRYQGPCLQNHFQTTYYCFSCKQFCCPTCMPVMHSRDNSKTKPSKGILEIEKMDIDGVFDNLKPNKRSKL